MRITFLRNKKKKKKRSAIFQAENVDSDSMIAITIQLKCLT